MCSPDTLEIPSYVDIEFEKILQEVTRHLIDDRREPDINCPGSLSVVPSKFFIKQTSAAFCRDVMKDLDREYFPTPYDLEGNKISPKLAALNAVDMRATTHTLRKRTPPEDPKSYKDYKVFLSYKPGNLNCRVPQQDLCRNAYEELVKSSCTYAPTWSSTL